MSRKVQRSEVSRRDVLKAGTVAAALAAGGSLARAAESVASAPASQASGLAASEPLPVRPLGRTGVKVTVINVGCGGAPDQRFLDHTWRQGMRYLDTAATYAKGKSEASIAAWFARTGKRKETFLVTKDEVYDGLESLLTLVDKRLEALKIDQIDCYMAHGLSVKEYGEQAVEWPKSKEFRQVADKLRKSGKVKFVGFSVHEADAYKYLEAAAEGGFVDVIMLGYNPVLGEKADKLNKAMDACHKAGIGLVAMKTMRGIGEQLKKDKANLQGQPLANAVIQAVLSDERIASICSAMANLPQVDQNAEAARSYKGPMGAVQREQLRAALLAGGMHYCPGCDACAERLTSSYTQDVTRYLSYFEQDGQRRLAREMYRGLPADAHGARPEDLRAAQQACACGVDFHGLVARASRTLA